MSFIDTVKSFASKTAKDAVKVSGEAVEFTKLKFKLAELNDKINNEYINIGKAVYKSSIGVEVDSDEMQQKCNLISELKVQTAELESEIAQITNKKQCPFCGAKNNADGIYCPKCGEKISSDNSDGE